MKIEKWCAVSCNCLGYEAPEADRVRLIGFVHGHPRFLDGREVTTSTVVGQARGGVITVSGSQYELGSSNAAYELLFPNARERLLANLEQRT